MYKLFNKIMHDEEERMARQSITLNRDEFKAEQFYSGRVGDNLNWIGDVHASFDPSGQQQPKPTVEETPTRGIKRAQPDFQKGLKLSNKKRKVDSSKEFYILLPSASNSASKLNKYNAVTFLKEGVFVFYLKSHSPVDLNQQNSCPPTTNPKPPKRW